MMHRHTYIKLSCWFENSSAKEPYKIDFVSHSMYLETEIQLASKMQWN